MKNSIRKHLKTPSAKNTGWILKLTLIIAMVISAVTGAVPGVVAKVQADETITVKYSTAEDGNKIDKNGVTCTDEYNDVEDFLMTGNFISLYGSFTKIVVKAAYVDKIGEKYGWTISGNIAVWEGNQQEVRFDLIRGFGKPIEIEFTVYLPDEYTVQLRGGGNSEYIGKIDQTVKVGSAMDEVTFNAKEGFYFPDFNPITVKGITVEKDSDSDSKITVSGTPTNSVSITNVPYAIRRTYPVTGISVDPTRQEKKEGELFSVQATLYPDYASDYSIIWNVDKEGVNLYSDNKCENPVALGEASYCYMVYGKALYGEGSDKSIAVTVSSHADSTKSATCTVVREEQPTIYTVTYDPRNGDNTYAVGVNEGEKIKTTDIHSSENYRNGDWTVYHQQYNNGWHKSPFKPGDGTFDFSNTPINSSMTLILVWESSFSVSTNNSNMGKIGYARKGTDPVAEASSASFTILKDYDDEYSFTAEPNADYRFVKWIDKAGNTVSEEKTITGYKCAAKGELKAVFERKALNVELGVTDGGEVLVTNEYPRTIKGPGAGSFSTRHESMTLKATPSEEYDFMGWYEGTVNKDTGYVDGNTGKLVSTNAEIEISRNSEYKAVQAVFDRKVLDVALGVTDKGEVLVTNEYPQTIKGPGAGNFSTRYEYMTLKATPSESCYLKGWYEGTVDPETGYVDGNTGRLVSKDPEIKIFRDSEYKAVQAVFEKIPYVCPQSGGQTWTKGSTSRLIFTFEATDSKDPFQNKNGIEIDGVEVKKDNYEEREGSWIIELKPEYLETLAAGGHQLKARFTDYEPGIIVNFAISEESGGKDSSPSKPVYRFPITGVE